MRYLKKIKPAQKQIYYIKIFEHDDKEKTVLTIIAMLSHIGSMYVEK